MEFDELVSFTLGGYSAKTRILGGELLNEIYKVLLIGQRAQQYLIPIKMGAVSRFRHGWSWRDPCEGVLLDDGTNARVFAEEAKAAEAAGGDMVGVPEGAAAEDVGAVEVSREAAIRGILKAANQVLDAKGQAELAMLLLERSGAAQQEGAIGADSEISEGGEAPSAEERAAMVKDILFATALLEEEDVRVLHGELAKRLQDSEADIKEEGKKMPAPKKKREMAAEGAQKPFDKKRHSPPEANPKPKKAMCMMRVRKLKI
ncbi:hypothetical protein JW721_02190 [Candidatus Micrarchaeota archaeon]|nr:hypothetical protein [Candidatus Micrarchaeota archaeon]